MNADAEPLDRPTATQYADWFRALADPTRIQIVSLLARRGEPMNVGQLTAAVAVGQSTVSAHLKVLAEARFVLAEQRGTATFYWINEACVGCFPTAADIVMGRPVPPPPVRSGRADRRPSAEGPAMTGDPARPAGVLIRPMTPADARAVLAIYQAGLDTGNASFETTAPDWDAFNRSRLPQHRHVAVSAAGDVLGWVAAWPVSARSVYSGVIEHSVYVHPAARGRGIGLIERRSTVAGT